MSAPNNNNVRPGNGNPPNIGNLTAAQTQAMQQHALYTANMAAQTQQAGGGAAMGMFPTTAAPGQPQPRPQPTQVNNDTMALWQQFMFEKREFQALAQRQGDPVAMRQVQEEFYKWNTQRGLLLQQQRQQQAAAAARPPAQPTVTPAARLATTTAAATSSLQQKALNSQNEALRKLSGQFAFISKPTSNEEKNFLPNNRLNLLAKKAYGDLGVGKLTPDAAAGMKIIASDFSKEAISYAIAATRRKRANKLDPNDVVVYLQHTWGIELPGFSITRAGGGVVAPYKRLSASEVHKARIAAVRRGNVAQTRLGVPAAAAGGGGGGDGAGPSGSAAAATVASPGTAAGKGTGKVVSKKKITSKAAFAAITAAAAAKTARGGASETEGEDGGADDDDMDEDDMPDI